MSLPFTKKTLTLALGQQLFRNQLALIEEQGTRKPELMKLLQKASSEAVNFHQLYADIGLAQSTLPYATGFKALEPIAETPASETLLAQETTATEERWVFSAITASNHVFVFGLVRRPLASPTVVNELNQPLTVANSSLWTVFGGYGKDSGDWVSIPFIVTAGRYEFLQRPDGETSFVVSLSGDEQLHGAELRFAGGKFSIDCSWVFRDTGDKHRIQAVLGDSTTATQKIVRAGKKRSGLVTNQWSQVLTLQSLSISSSEARLDETSGQAWFDREWQQVSGNPKKDVARQQHITLCFILPDLQPLVITATGTDKIQPGQTLEASVEGGADKAVTQAAVIPRNFYRWGNYYYPISFSVRVANREWEVKPSAVGIVSIFQDLEHVKGVGVVQESKQQDSEPGQRGIAFMSVSPNLSESAYDNLLLAEAGIPEMSNEFRQSFQGSRATKIGFTLAIVVGVIVGIVIYRRLKR